MDELLSIGTRLSHRLARTHDVQTRHAVDVMGGGPTSAIIRKMPATSATG